MFNCDKCSHKDCDGEKTKAIGIKRWKMDIEVDSYACPLTMITDMSWTLLDWHKHYKNGILLKSGGLLEQPNFYLEMMNILERRGYHGNNNSNN